MTIIDPPAAAALTAAAFEQFAALPEHRDKRLEFIAGSIANVVSNDIASVIAMIIGRLLGNHVAAHKLGRVSGADGGYVVGDARYMPDVAFISKARMPKPANAAWVPIAPDLAVEVISPSDAPSHLRVKVVDYLNAGAVVWLVDPAARTIEVYTPGQSPKLLKPGDTLDGGAILPGLTLSIQQVFDELDAD